MGRFFETASTCVLILLRILSPYVAYFGKKGDNFFFKKFFFELFIYKVLKKIIEKIFVKNISLFYHAINREPKKFFVSHHGGPKVFLLFMFVLFDRIVRYTITANVGIMYL